MESKDGLPDTICLSCESNLEQFTNFKNTFLLSDRALRLKLINDIRIKVEEVLIKNCNGSPKKRSCT